MLAELLTEIRPALYLLLSTAAAIVLGIAVKGLRVLQQHATEWLDGLSRDRRWKAAIARLDAAAGAAVDEVEQRMGAELRAAQPNPGRLSGEQARRMLAEAVTVARQHFGAETWAGVCADLELSPERVLQVLRTRLESAVRQRKLGSGAVIELAAAADPPGSPASVDPDASTVRTTLDPADSSEDLP